MKKSIFIFLLESNLKYVYVLPIDPSPRFIVIPIPQWPAPPAVTSGQKNQSLNIGIFCHRQGLSEVVVNTILVAVDCRVLKNISLQSNHTEDSSYIKY